MGRKNWKRRWFRLAPASRALWYYSSQAIDDHALPKVRPRCALWLPATHGGGVHCDVHCGVRCGVRCG